MYLPIPEGVNVTKSVTASRPKSQCADAESITRTATFSMPKSTAFREKMNDSVRFEINRPTDGSWQRIKKSGSIKMTPMSIINERTTHSVGQVQVPFIRVNIARSGSAWAVVNGKCVNCVKVAHWDCKAAIVKGRYVEQGDLSYWKTKYPFAKHYKMHGGELDSDKVEAVKSEAYAELYQTFNLGEEIAELRETIAGVTKLTSEAVDLIRESRDFITDLLRKDELKEAGSRWMEFRYGIMPIMYSIQDLLKLQAEKGHYKTVRKYVSPEIVMPEDPGSDPVYFQDVGTVDVRCSITAKARWASEELKRFDLININPLTTTTAILPWSMVVRWFFNVQSYLDCRVKSLTSLALESRACVAIREKREYGTYLHLTTGYPSTHVFDSGASSCGPSLYPSTDFGTYEDLLEHNVLLTWYSVNNYSRYLYQPSDVKLVFNPYISWQRTIDAFVLMMGSMSKLLRRLK